MPSLYFHRLRISVLGLGLLGFLSLPVASQSGDGQDIFDQKESALSSLLTQIQPQAATRMVDLTLVTYQDIEALFPPNLLTAMFSNQPIERVINPTEPISLGEFSLLIQALDPSLQVSLGSRLFASGRQAFRDMVFLNLAEPFWDYRSLVSGRTVLELLGRYTLHNQGSMP